MQTKIMPIIATPPRLHTTAIIIVLLPPKTNKTHIINHLKEMVTLHNSAVWPVPYACAQPYHPGSGSRGDPRLHTHALHETVLQSQPTATTCTVRSWRLYEYIALASVVKGLNTGISSVH